jgi:hypothetical protein
VTARPTDVDQRYLLVKGSSGLGNRILCALTGILYARVTGRRLIVDWCDGVYADSGTNAFPRLFDQPSAGELDELPDTASVVPRIWRGHLRDSARGVQRAYYRTPRGVVFGALERMRVISRRSMVRRLQRDLSVDVAGSAHDEAVAVLWSYEERISAMRPLLRGEFAELGRLTTPEILRGLLARDLRLRPEIQIRVDEFRKEHLEGPTVGVHLRLSDRRVQVDRVLVELDSLLAREPGLTIFAATDSIEGKELLEDRYARVRLTQHWYASAGAPLHKDPSRPDRLERGIEALVDLYLLGGCDHLIGDGSSSFTAIAALLASSRGAHVVDVSGRVAASRASAVRRQTNRGL